MICSDCGREIADGSLSCQYCGKIFVSQRARSGEPAPSLAPASQQVTDLQGKLQRQELATDKAISFRRKQRWVFYAVISAVFLGAVGMAVSIYGDYTKLASSYASLNTKFQSKEKEYDQISKELQDTQILLNDNNASATQLRDELIKNRNSLKDMTERNQKLETELAGIKQSSELSTAMVAKQEALIYNLVFRLGLKLKASDLVAVPLASVDSDMLDTDKDGLADEFESQIGTSELKMDSDGDGYDDKAELIGGFNPTGEGRWPDKVIEGYKGRILISDHNGVYSAWYVSQNGKRNYLGNLDNNFKFMIQSSYWNTKEAL